MISLLKTHLLIKNEHYLMRYISFINHMSKRILNENKANLHLHHILPKAKDFFPEYKNLKHFPENGIYLTTREHFIAHKILSLAFPGSSQTLAFYYMSNVMGIKKSKAYALAKELHSKKMKETVYTPERNLKVSMALKGVPKTEEHKQKLRKPRTEEEKRAISIGTRAAAFKFSDEQKSEMSQRRKGKALPNTEKSLKQMAETKTQFLMVTPIGVFRTYADAEKAFGVDIRYIFNRQNSLNKVPSKKIALRVLGHPNTERLTWTELGFSKLQK